MLRPPSAKDLRAIAYYTGLAVTCFGLLLGRVSVYSNLAGLVRKGLFQVLSAHGAGRQCRFCGGGN